MKDILFVGIKTILKILPNYFFYLTCILTHLIIDGFCGTNQKQSLWTSIVSKCAQWNINIKINDKRCFGILDTGSDITIFSKHLWPKSWPIQRISCQIAGVPQNKV